MSKIKKFAAGHKIISIVILTGVGWGAYAWFSATHDATAVAKYVVEKATTGTVIASVSGSGQMQAVSTIDIKPQTSEPVVSIAVKVGQHVNAGQLLIQLDTTNERRALTQAQLQLQSAQLSYAKLTENPATTTVIQDQNAISQAQSNIQTASANLNKDYQSAFDTLTTSFVDFQTIMTGLQNFAIGGDVVKGQGDPDAYYNLVPMYMQAGLSPYKDAVYAAYQSAATQYQQNLTDYQKTSRSAGEPSLDALFSETNQTAQSISEAVKAAKNFLTYLVNNYPTTQGYTPLPTVTNTLQTNMGTYTNTISSDVGSIMGAINAIASDKTSLSNNQLSLTQASSALQQLMAGADPLDIQSNQLSVQQQQLALQTAEQNLANDSIRAPVDGIVSAIPSVVGGMVPSPAVSMVGNNQIAQVTLNEVDAAKVQVGDKATLTFDAIPNLTVAGQVVEIDPVGTVSQGVVSYNAQIQLASANDQVKPGMSVSVNIVTEVAQDALVVPRSAITTQGGVSYILVPSTSVSDADIASSTNGGIILSTPPMRVQVTTGISDNTQTQIVSGINPGDEFIAQAVTSAAKTTTSGAGGTNALRGLGGGGGGVFLGGGGGGNVRVGGGGG